ncbi:integrase [Vibrio parahaemolyticus]|uniref:tyrosine-type recombinase/integrase n=1 Tax=Vibrio parahaemolyticus TaxID=670 RepID=UPI00084B6067|nr:tyrosine-type recombinase/integrase [Vibrio parahaemolyticus]EGR0744799.1 site-specific integrase [Vibrio parahaemolyticus]EGR1181088.1 site-specific integrase [Vibrio parahaemolyticus]EGR2223217.1 site-specific integrase [Vibrio parahaemolyticus]EGR3029629.1 site-specific integrase [Vibrio parahaemolyticus]EHO8532244.1 tyrosine-type recombinase/integrase [Vibrio parahaemolyticus]
MIETHEEKFSDVYDDYRLLSVEVDTLAKLRISANINTESGEVTHSPDLSPSNLESRLKETDIIIAPDGTIVYPQSLYLVSKLRGEEAVKDTGSIAKGLLAFTRYLDSTHHARVDKNGVEIPPEYLTYKTLSKYEEEGAPWRFAEFLLANCNNIEGAYGDEAFSLSTARSYMSAVIGFYKWMQKYGYIKNNDQNVVTHYTTGTVHHEVNQHDMLAHTKSGSERSYETSNIMRMFPKKENTPAHKKLKPMHPEHKALFNEHVMSLPKSTELIFRLCVEVGLRIDEAIHFPAHDIGKADYSDLDAVPIKITRTKGSKERTVDIPITLYEELEIYKESHARLKNLNKRNELDQSGEELDTVDYLFLSNKGTPYSVNTLETHFSNLRKQIREVDSSWYYRIHDLRSTFATHWLWKESKARDVGYDYLMDELAQLMGHASTSTTEKYIKYMNKLDDQISMAKAKNRKINGGWS